MGALQGVRKKYATLLLPDFPDSLWNLLFCFGLLTQMYYLFLSYYSFLRSFLAFGSRFPLKKYAEKISFASVQAFATYKQVKNIA